MDRVHYAHIDEAGVLTMDLPVVYGQALRALAGQPVEVIVRKVRSKRSDRQNAWYWGQVLELIAEHTGNDADDLHEYFKSRFIPKRLAICDGNGEVIDDRVIGGSTTKLSTAEMADYCESIRRFAVEELNLAIPDPDPAWRIFGQTKKEIVGNS